MLKPHSRKLKEDLFESKVQVKVKREEEEEEEKVGAEGERSRHGTDHPPLAREALGSRNATEVPHLGWGLCQGTCAVKEGGSAAHAAPDTFFVASAQPVGNSLRRSDVTSDSCSRSACSGLQRHTSVPFLHCLPSNSEFLME